MPDNRPPDFPALSPEADDAPRPAVRSAEALFEDIENFDLEAAHRRAIGMHATTVRSFGSASVFPALGEPGTREALAREPGGEARPAAAPAGPAAAAAGPAGLLAQLRGEAERRRRADDEAALRLGTARSELDARLRASFEFFHDFVRQLDYLQPAIPRIYHFLGPDDAFRGLAWQRGFADFRSLPEREGGGIERVMLGYTLKGPGLRTLEREGSGAIERLRRTLFDLGLRFECRERRNERQIVEHACFTFAEEIPVQAVWRADFSERRVLLETRNLERLGYASFSIPVEALGARLLDEFGRLVLGEDNRFRALARGDAA